MKKNNKIYLTEDVFRLLLILCSTVFLLVISLRATAQDQHYAHYFQGGAFTSPSLVLPSEYNSKISAIYRNQWSALDVPFRSYGINFEHRTTRGFVLGGLINQNEAGEIGIKRTHIMAKLAYQKQLGQRGGYLVAGIQGGYAQFRLPTNGLTFDNQYNPDMGFDPSISSNESFITSQGGVDFDAGLHGHFFLTENLSVHTGVALAHLMRPSFSFLENEEILYPIKTTFYINPIYTINSKTKAAPFLSYMKQDKAKNLLLGGLIHYQAKPSLNLRAGLGLRRNDAVLLYGGFEYKKIDLGLSYGFNTSSLRTAASNNAAFELIATYRFDIKNIANPKPLPISDIENCTSNGLVDRDCDGLADAFDQCPDLAGKMEYKGCPDENSCDCSLDTDGDGVPDKEDLCPYIPGLMALQGCNDMDNDGILDYADTCPHIYGDKSNAGCPTNHKALDTDGDGVLDEVDECIYIKGLANLAGCPDYDLDGLSDMEDQCPYEKGPLANAGCPYPNTLTSATQRRSIRVENVYFDTDKYIIKGDYQRMLDQLAYDLQANPQYSLMLTGHTDSEGADSYNQVLSRDRVMAVMTYLTRRGIDPSRISTQYYGESRPADSNATHHGKAKNRRTEITLLNSGILGNE